MAIDCNDIDGQLGFWAEALGYERFGASGPYRSLVPPPGVAGPKIILQAVEEPRPDTKNRLHLDLIVGAGIETEVARLESLGASRLSQRIEESGTAWIVMADPEGNEFCVCVS